ncbi:MAG: TonB-dependent receptor [Proteobacteria bacterium]|nr:TonB-dependent receptor [Pseudomonadota bacterium]
MQRSAWWSSIALEPALLAALVAGATGLLPLPTRAAPGPRAAPAATEVGAAATRSDHPTASLPAPDSAPAADDPLQDVVLSAMKTPTTVQQAPATITVLTGEKIERQGHQTLGDAVATVPGFLPFRYAYGGASAPIARGILFGTLYLLDGLDMYDPAGFPLLTEWLPVELVQRAEITSGPGGVLWGSNSFVGVGNVITKSADDVNGLRAHASVGTATAGQRDQLRTYLMGGTKLLGGWLKLFAHAYYRTWIDRGIEMPVRVIATEGGVVTTERPFVTGGPRSRDFGGSINLGAGPWSLIVHLPRVQRASPIGINAVAPQVNLEEDRLDCSDPTRGALCGARVDADRISRSLRYDIGVRAGILRFRRRLLRERLGLDARAFFADYWIGYKPIIGLVPFGLAPGGLAANELYRSHRVGASVDVDLALPYRTQVLFGGELFYDWLNSYRATLRLEPATLGQLGFACDPAADGRSCTVPLTAASNRLAGGLFANAQHRLLPALTLTAGSRLQLYAGRRALDPVVLFSGAAVWSPSPAWNLKASYAEGFRPPSLVKTDNARVGFLIPGNPELRVERSRALQGQVNTRLVQRREGVRELTLRADYSYTWITDFIAEVGNQFNNVPGIGTHAVELLAQLALTAGHSLSLGYSFNDSAIKDLGKLRSLPNQWFVLQAVFNLWRERLLLNTNLTVTGSLEDPNLIGRTPFGTSRLGRIENGQPVEEPLRISGFTDRYFERVGPQAQWNLGLRYLLVGRRLALFGNAFNVLDARGFEGQGFMDPIANPDIVPAPLRGFSFLAGAETSL